MLSNECCKNACGEKDLVYGVTETGSAQFGLEMSAITSVSPPFYFQRDFCQKTRENTVNMRPPGRPTLLEIQVRKLGFRV